jgi:hypothetical protein
MALSRLRRVRVAKPRREEVSVQASSIQHAVLQEAHQRGFTCRDYLAGTSEQKRRLSTGEYELMWATRRRPRLKWIAFDAARAARSLGSTKHRLSPAPSDGASLPIKINWSVKSGVWHTANGGLPVAPSVASPAVRRGAALGRGAEVQGRVRARAVVAGVAGAVGGGCWR